MGAATNKIVEISGIYYACRASIGLQ